MKIAFDVKGTLVGENQDKVREFFSWCVAAGHEVTVWSNVGSNAAAVAGELGYSGPAHSKETKADLRCAVNPLRYYQDLAIDDEVDYVCCLAAKNFISVRDLVELSNWAEFEQIMQHNLTCREEECLNQSS